MAAIHNKAILQAIHDSGGSLSTARKTGRSFHMQAALIWLYENRYVYAMGKDWETAIFCITDKGRAYLKELQVIE